MAEDLLRRIADAVLYEGYVLWPYRRDALKNRQRFTFGGVYPEGWSASGHDDDSPVMKTELLVEDGPHATVEVSVRFLHIVSRRVASVSADGSLELVDALTVDGERHLSWEEATEREFSSGPVAVAEVEARPVRVPIDIAAGTETEDLRGADGDRAVGALVRSWGRLAGELEISGERLSPGLLRLRVRVSNATPWPGGSREEALERTFCSTHAAIRARGAALVSLTDPPEALREAAEACENRGAWPVLVGDEGERDTVLASPIILADHPEIAPESPGELFDGGEIDQLLTLGILSMTDEEKEDMRATDPRTRAILERTEALSPDQIMSLHGTVRDFSVRSR